MIWNITFKDCCLENCLSIWASQNMVYGCCCFIGNPSGFICGWYHDVFTDFIWSRTLRLKSTATWICLFESFIRENVLEWLHLTFRLSMQDIKNCILSVFEKNFYWKWCYIIRIYAQTISYFKLYGLMDIQWESSLLLCFLTWWIFV